KNLAALRYGEAALSGFNFHRKPEFPVFGATATPSPSADTLQAAFTAQQQMGNSAREVIGGL
ncbi:MAG: hypothetical protein ACREBW_07400, partial [Candidatus Micrarchaeaceae archaeon]